MRAVQLQDAPLPMTRSSDVRFMLDCLPATACGRVEERGDVCGIGDEGRDAFAQKPVRAGTRRAGNRTGDCADGVAELRGAGGEVEGAGAVTGFHDDGHTGDCAKDAVAGEKPPLGRRRAGRHFAGEQPEVSDSFQQLPLPDG